MPLQCRHMDFGECCGVIKAACTLKIEVQAAFWVCGHYYGEPAFGFRAIRIKDEIVKAFF